MFYDKYAELCKQKGITPTAAALEIGLSKATPTKWKNSGATPSGENLKKIAVYFGITVLCQAFRHRCREKQKCRD